MLDMNAVADGYLLQLRSRVLELENSIDHCTNPEVEKLTKEVSTLEDLLEETQR